MTRPPSLIDWVLDRPWFRNSTRRRLTFLAAALVAGALAVFPRPYTAEAQLMPQEGGGGLSSVLASQASGALLNLSVLTGSRTSIEEDVTIARGHDVIQEAIARLHIVGRPGFPDATSAEAKLSHKVSITAIRGSIIQVQATDHDEAFVKAFVGAVADAIRQRLAEISLQQAVEKRQVTINRLQDASERLAKAQDALNQYRLGKKLPSPEMQLGAGVGNLSALQAQLQSKEVELQTLSQVATPNNIQVKLVQADVDSLRNQIAQAQKTSGGALAGVAVANTEYYDRVRDVNVAQLLYQVYSRYLDEITIDEMSANQNVEMIQPVFVNPTRGYNLISVGLLSLIIALAVGAEYYAVGARSRPAG